MKLPFCPPLPILWAERGDDSGPAAVIHKTYLREARRERTGWSRAKLIAKFFTLWPVLNLALIAWYTWLNGSAVKRRIFLLQFHHIGRLPHVKQQIVDMVLNGSAIRDTARVLRVSPTTMMGTLKKKRRRSTR